MAIYATVLLVAPAKKQTGFFFSASTQTAIALYIIVVGLIYNIVLRQLWDSSGLQAVLHDLLHTLAPALTLIYWWKWVNTKTRSFNDIPAWLIYPAIYAIAVIARGHWPNWYPYPFLDPGKIGYSKVLINSEGLVVLFLVFSFLLVFVGKKKSFTAS